MIEFPFVVGSELDMNQRGLLGALEAVRQSRSIPNRTFQVLVVDKLSKKPIYASSEYPDFQDSRGVLESATLRNLAYPNLKIVIKRNERTRRGFFSSYYAIPYSGPDIERRRNKTADDPSSSEEKKRLVRRLKSAASKLHSRTARAVTARNRDRRRGSYTSTLRPNPEELANSMVQYEMIDGIVQVNTRINVLTYRRIWTGTQTPGFRTKKPKQLPFNDHSVYIKTQIDKGRYSQRTNGWSTAPDVFKFEPYSLRLGTSSSGNAPPTIVHSSDGRNKAIKSLIARADRGTNNVALTLLQVSQLTRMIETTCTRITGSITALKHGNIPQAVKSLWGKKKPRYRKGSKGPKPNASTADNWLELQYGWKPLLSDVHGAFENLAKLNLGDVAVQKISASSRSKDEELTDIITTYGGSWTKVIGGRLVSTSTDSKFTISYRVDSHVRAFLSQTGFTNLPNLAWEAIPYSFVVDWFVPVGPFLESLSSFEGLEFLSGSEVQFTRQNTLYVVDSEYMPGNEPSEGIVLTKGLLVVDEIKLDRTALGGWPGLSLPHFKNPFSVGHAQNALALMASAFSRR